jgi:hypothetical protein
MWFLFGLMIGSATMSGHNNGGAGIAGQIPLRCYAAIGDDMAYRRCRYASMMGELLAATVPAAGNTGLCWAVWAGRERNYDFGPALKSSDTCNIDAAIALELRALRKLDEMAKAKQPSN